MRNWLFLLFLFAVLPFWACGQQPEPNISLHNQISAILVDSVSAPTKKERNLARYEKEILRYEQADKTNPPQKNGILFVGSSSIRLWKTLATDMSGLPVTNRGFGGATIAEVNHYFRRIVLPYSPQIVVFYAGENDLFHPDISIDSVLSDFKVFQDSLHVYFPDCKAYFMSVKPSPSRWVFQEKFTEANTRFRALCSASSNWTYIDIVPAMISPQGRPYPQLFRSDSLHMNAEGYARWKSAVAPVIRQQWRELR